MRSMKKFVPTSVAELVPCVYGSLHTREFCVRSSERAEMSMRNSHPPATQSMHLGPPLDSEGDASATHACPW